jgi:hypothetical protein
MRAPAGYKRSLCPQGLTCATAHRSIAPMNDLHISPSAPRFAAWLAIHATDLDSNAGIGLQNCLIGDSASEVRDQIIEALGAIGAHNPRMAAARLYPFRSNARTNRTRPIGGGLSASVYPCEATSGVNLSRELPFPS